MNRTTYLLLKIAEEAAEISQMASKTAQFGTSGRYQGGPSNLERLSDELRQLTTVCAMLAQRQREVKGEEFDFGNTVNVPQYDDAKVERVERYFKQAILNPDFMPAMPTTPKEPELEPFNPLAWAAENLDTWWPMAAGHRYGVVWETVGDSADRHPPGFVITCSHRSDFVSLRSWVKARRALGLESDFVARDA